MLACFRWQSRVNRDAIGSILTVVELRFWAAERGYTPLILEAERSADGSLLVYCSSATAATPWKARLRFLHRRTAVRLWRLGALRRDTWVLSRYRGETRVLDVGHVHAEPRYLQARDGLRIPFLVGLDLAARPQPGIRGVAGTCSQPPSGLEYSTLYLQYP